MIEKITTLLQKSSRDYSFWACLLNHTPFCDWVKSQATTAVRTERKVVLATTSLRFRDKQGNYCGMGLTAPAVADLDELWLSCEGCRPSAVRRRIFSHYIGVNPAASDRLTTAYYLAVLLFGSKLKDKRLVSVINLQDEGLAEVAAFICFVYNVVIGFETDVYFEPSYPRNANFWDGALQTHQPSGAVFGLVAVAQANSSRWSMVETVLCRLSEQIEHDSWRCSACSWTQQAAIASGNSANVGGDVALGLLGKALVLGGSGLTSYYDVRAAAMAGAIPYEDPIAFLEVAGGVRPAKRITDAGVSAILRRGTQSYPTALSQGALPPFALYKVAWDASTRSFSAEYIDTTRVRDASEGQYVLLDLRYMLKGAQGSIPHKYLPECLALAVSSLLCSADLFQRAVALNTEAVSLIQTITTSLNGAFGSRDVEWTYSKLGPWWFKDRAPLLHEIGSKAWLFTNEGLCYAPRAATGPVAQTAVNDLPDTFVVDGVTLVKQTSTGLNIEYRRL